MEWTPARMLARLDGDVELAQQLAAIFIEESPRMANRLREAVAEGSADAVQRAAHALKGSLSNFIDGGPMATAFELETMGRNGRLDEASRTLARLDGEIADLVTALKEFQSRGAGNQAT
jgi:HPt (histidine-containing phosphotransfer) domain-containing protein